MSVFETPHDTRYYQKLWELNNDPEGYKRRLKEKADADWEEAKKSGINIEMTRQENERVARLAEEKRLAALGPNFPKVWDLSYVKEDPQKIFIRKSNDEIEWDFFKFRVFVNETDYFDTNFYENLDKLKWKNTA